jgi:hypothetical protein
MFFILFLFYLIYILFMTSNNVYVFTRMKNTCLPCYWLLPAVRPQRLLCRFIGIIRVKHYIWTQIIYCRSWWPRGLRRRSAAARLLALWVRPRWGHECLSLVSVVCCQVEVSASVWSLVRRSSTECGLSECGHEPSIMSRSWPNGCCYNMVNKLFLSYNFHISAWLPPFHMHDCSCGRHNVFFFCLDYLKID